MKYTGESIPWIFAILFFLFTVYFLMTGSTGHPSHAVYYRYLSPDHELPMIEYYYPAPKITGWSNKYNLSIVFYREDPKTNVYDRLLHWSSRNKKPVVENTIRDVDLRDYIPTLGPDEYPPRTLYNTNVFLTPAYRRAVEAHTKSHEGYNEGGER